MARSSISKTVRSKKIKPKIIKDIAVIRLTPKKVKMSDNKKAKIPKAKPIKIKSVKKLLQEL